jgi:hypothetical protein
LTRPNVLVVHFLLGLCVAGMHSSAARADGKFYVRDEVPANQPFQRALLVHGEGREFLLIQPQLVGAATDFAWVVPVPAQPELGSLDADAAERFVFFRLQWESHARLVRWGYSAVMIALMLSVFFVVFLFPGRRWALGYRVALLLGLLLFVLLVSVSFTTLGRDIPKDDEGIEVLDSQQLGIYDATVVRASDPGALRRWLDERGFRMGAKDEPVLRSYVERGWCFVACRISRDKGDVGAGLIDALALSFPSPAPVYPFALTATSGETDVLLYVGSDQKVSHPAMDLKYAGPSDWAVRLEDFWSSPQPPVPDGKKEHWITWASVKEGRPPPEMPRSPGFLTKLRGRLSDKNVRGDLDLTRAPDDEPYRRAVWRW